VRRLFQNVTEQVQAFLGQQDDVLLLVRSRDEDGALLFKILEPIEEASADIFWFFHNDFTDPKAYVRSVVESFQKRAELLEKKLQEGGEPPWPTVPEPVVDPAADPVTRLQALFTYMRERMADLEASHLVVVLLPLRIAQPWQYRAFVRELISFDLMSPWCHHMRFIMREPLHAPMGKSEKPTKLDPVAFPATRIYPIDFSLEALQKATKEEIGDSNVPLADRLQSLLIDANVDYAHKRYLVAEEKYQLLRTYYAEVKNHALLAAALNGLGEVHAALKPAKQHRDMAIHYFEMAVTAAIEGKSHPILLNVALNLANLYLVHKNWAQAAEHYVAAEALATALLNGGVKLLCLENIGACRSKLAQWALADRAWRDGATLARSLKEHDAQRRLLHHLRAMYKEARMRDRVKAIDAELRSVK